MTTPTHRRAEDLSPAEVAQALERGEVLSVDFATAGPPYVEPIFVKAWHTASMILVQELMRFDPKLGTPMGDLLDAIVNAVEVYEKQAFPFTDEPPANPEEGTKP